jgi:hypothetical protein
MNKDFKKKILYKLLKKNELNNEHSILNANILKDSEKNEPIQPEQNSVWPVEPNLLVETARFENNVLHVTFTNLSVEPIKIESMGVKYTSIDTENIDFQPVNITLPTGESVIQIPCPRGNPFKFVVRTTNKTGSGSSKENMNW